MTDEQVRLIQVLDQLERVQDEARILSWEHDLLVRQIANEDGGAFADER